MHGCMVCHSNLYASLATSHTPKPAKTWLVHDPSPPHPHAPIPYPTGLCPAPENPPPPLPLPLCLGFTARSFEQSLSMSSLLKAPED
eukprot:scaffold2630_cov118-Isochrysis_galbana.AAC.12